LAAARRDLRFDVVGIEGAIDPLDNRLYAAWNRRWNLEIDPAHGLPFLG